MAGRGLQEYAAQCEIIHLFATGFVRQEFSKVLDRLGIDEQVKTKIKPNALARVPQVVAAGEVELAT